ncbi:MAG TPA: hypothetical protein VEE84_02015, partial [Burkholderiaceae bacterium]|nr:hypothetical protein [Burkholderiaceae bacterium]
RTATAAPVARSRVDDDPSMSEPEIGNSAGADLLGQVARDHQLPFVWMYPWLLALAAIGITLFLAS